MNNYLNTANKLVEVALSGSDLVDAARPLDRSPGRWAFMTLDNIIQAIYKSSPNTEEFKKIATEKNLETNELLDSISREVAINYMENVYAWEFCDVVMNNLFGFMMNNTDIPVADFSFGVYIAFDEGEYIHRNDTSIQDGEPRTRLLLEKLLGQDNA